MGQYPALGKVSRKFLRDSWDRVVVTDLSNVYNSTFPLWQGQGYGLTKIPPQTPQLSLF